MNDDEIKRMYDECWKKYVDPPPLTLFQWFCNVSIGALILIVLYCISS